MLTTSTTCGTTWTDSGPASTARAWLRTRTVAAHDESGAVSVETDAKGVLRSVTIAMDWSAKVAPQALSAAVLDAVAALATQRLEEVGRALEKASTGRPQRARRCRLSTKLSPGTSRERLGEGAAGRRSTPSGWP